jgi:hypothetical protein
MDHTSAADSYKDCAEKPNLRERGLRPQKLEGFYRKRLAGSNGDELIDPLGRHVEG